jgi:hypothetical protein
MGAPARSTTIHIPNRTKKITPALIAGCTIILSRTGYFEFGKVG